MRRRTSFNFPRALLEDSGLFGDHALKLAARDGLPLRILLLVWSGDVLLDPQTTTLTDIARCVDPHFDEGKTKIEWPSFRRRITDSLDKLHSLGLIEKSRVDRERLIIGRGYVDSTLVKIPRNLVRNGWAGGSRHGEASRLDGKSLLLLLRLLVAARASRPVSPLGQKFPRASRYLPVDDVEPGFSRPSLRKAWQALEEAALVHIRRSERPQWVIMLDPDLETRPKP
jgi:hypothetical protein